MAAAGGSALEQIQINLIINTVAQMQQLHQFTSELERMGERVQQRNPLGQFTKSTQEQFSKLQRSGRELSQILQENFGPRFISSTGQANAALVRIGTTLETFSTKALKTKQINEAQAVSMQQLAGQITGVGVTGQASADSLQSLINRLSQIQATGMLGRSTINALNTELVGLQEQIKRIEIEKNLSQPPTGAAAAGQGLLLSFSIAQALAGRLSGALFGLGFALIFTKTGFLNLITVGVALGATLLSIGVDKLQDSFTHKVRPAADIATEALDRFKDKLESVQAMAGVELPAGMPEWVLPDFTQQIIASRQLGQELVNLARQGEPVGSVFLDMAQKLSKMPESFTEARRWSETFKEFSIDTAAFMKEASSSVQQEVSAIMAEARRVEQFELRLRPIEIRRDQVTATFDAQREALQAQLSQAEDTIRANSESQIDTRRRALEREVDIIRDGYDNQTDVIREKLENQLDAIRDASDKKIDVIRDRLDTELELVNNRLDIRIETIKKNAEKELGVNKDRIDSLKTQERELTQTLSALRNKREEVRADIIGQEAQLAAIERDARASGVLALEEQGIIKARIEGLKKEDNALSNTIANREKSLASIQTQIDAIDTLITKIENARDKAIKSAKDEADRRTKIIRDAADAEIKAVQNAATLRERAARKSSDIQIKAVNDARDASIRAANNAADVQIRAMQRTADNTITQYRNAAKRVESAFNIVKTVQIGILDQQIRQIRKADDLARKLREQTDILRVQAQTLLSMTLITTGKLGQFDPHMPGGINAWIMRELRKIVPGMSNEVFRLLGLIPSRQLGGIVPGAIGQPKLIMAHGGEEVKRPDQRLLPSGNITFVIENLNVSDPSEMDKFERVINRSLGKKTRLAMRSKRFMIR